MVECAREPPGEPEVSRLRRRPHPSPRGRRRRPNAEGCEGHPNETTNGEGMQSQDLRRGSATSRRALRRTLFAATPPPDAEVEDLREQLECAERKLAAVVAASGLDETAIRALTTHVRFLCRPTGYAVRESDGPPLEVEEEAQIDGDVFVVERLSASPFPGDARRCVILVCRDEVEPPTGYSPGQPLQSPLLISM
jgi:hypothetical protein